MTRAQRPPEEMIRFVMDPAGLVVPDIRRKLPGRGVWVTGETRYIAEAIKRSAFTRGFKKPAIVPADLVSLIDKTLEKDVLQSLSIANKAGAVTAGAFQVEKAVSAGDTAVLIHASDGGFDGARKFRQAVRRYMLEPEQVFFLEFLDSGQIGLALGRASVVHAAVRRGATAEALLMRVRRLEIYRGLRPSSAGSETAESSDPLGSEYGQLPGIEN